MRFAILVSLFACSVVGGCSSSSSGPKNQTACPSATDVLQSSSCSQGGQVCTGTVIDHCGSSLGSSFQCACADGIWQCEGADASSPSCDDAGGIDAGEPGDASDGSCTTCDAGMGTCPPASSVVSGTACTQTGMFCTGTIDNNCGTPIGSTFSCQCSSGHWQCEGPDASGATCDGGHD